MLIPPNIGRSGIFHTFALKVLRENPDTEKVSSMQAMLADKFVKKVLEAKN